jgi:hypothetical protein
MSETALLRAVRDQIRTHASFTDRQVQIELDENYCPAIVGDLYVMVIPAGQSEGEHQSQARYASDVIYAVDITVVMRAPKVPRDRQREILIDTAASLEVYQLAIESKIDWQEAVRTAANVYVAAEGGGSPFTEELKYTGCGRIRRAPSELFTAAAGEPVAAIMRTYHYRGSRRVKTRS